MPELILPPKILSGRRAFLAGSLAAAGALVLPGCASYGGQFSFTEAIRRLLLLSSENAFDVGAWTVMRVESSGRLASMAMAPGTTS